MKKREFNIGDLVCRRKVPGDTGLGIILPFPGSKGKWGVYWFWGDMDGGAFGCSYPPKDIGDIAIHLEERLGT